MSSTLRPATSFSREHDRRGCRCPDSSARDLLPKLIIDFVGLTARDPPRRYVVIINNKNEGLLVTCCTRPLLLSIRIKANRRPCQPPCS
ncbi:uncharacterized protein LACBIDRAFT_307112 [Laccaria bicolor S238N-H82]|uniref:Predicted protein n=1 Tax=Laccaria bicolor (strain S238N-H82 / ATCC MYA-4686) TaxID=486041 RepID=B0DPE9_LACBS|nr:uncharacterized protein LACBIDRAFT_307112 [Laccaria bicolor S238N-H82]EDR03603.1 predicted protein [Laccaria bicolor S238N-H82]|eukprot:XP_001885751.1 predicted protein [Laccaria bicolor S238N-H82]